MKNIILLFFLFPTTTIYCQEKNDTILPPVFGGFVDVYNTINFNNPESGNMPGFLYNHTTPNQIAINLAMLKTRFANDNFRANIALMTGSYTQQNLAAEPVYARMIYEANIGIKIAKKHNTWIDAGVFPSHIGFESAISKDCPSLTRSLMAENSPYYETGAKLTHESKNEKWAISAFLLNGWQHIVRSPYNKIPAFGWQIIYKLNENITLNSSSFIGKELADSLNQTRLFHNFYVIWNISKKFNLIADIDNGVEQKYKSNKYNSWFSVCAIARYQISQKNSLSLRAEYYEDVNHVIIGYTNGYSFACTGSSLNFDHRFNEHIHIRIEGKVYNAKHNIFEKEKQFTNTLGLLTTSLCAHF